MIEVENGSGNVFADLEIPGADQSQIKARLGRQNRRDHQVLALTVRGGGGDIPTLRVVIHNPKGLLTYLTSIDQKHTIFEEEHKMNIKQPLLALAIGGMSLTGAMSTHAANTFSFAGGGAVAGDGAAPTGSWFRFLAGDTDDDGIPDLYDYSALRAPGSTDIPGPNGTLSFDVVNTLTLATTGGGHNSGNMIDRDSSFLGEWAAHSTTGVLEITWDGLSNTATVNMSDWRWNFNGFTYDQGAGGSALLNNQDGIWGNGDDTLDYSTIMTGGFAGVEYGLHLVGSASLMPVPEASTYGMMLAGLGLVGFAVRRRK